MNWYKRYMGDYARDTTRLSLIEHGAYSMLLDAYYSAATPLPAAKGELYRIAKAMTPAERKAVDMVADTFFPITADGMRHNVRADREITKRCEQAETNQRIADERERKRKRNETLDESCTNRSTNRSTNDEPTRYQIPERQKPDADGVQSVWDFGQTILADQGMKPGSARGFIGSLLKDWDEPVVEAAIRSATGKADARGYILGVLRTKPKRGQAEVKRVSI